MQRGHAYIWEYRARPGCEDAFVHLYGPQGDWVALFRRAEGYIGTTLLRDQHDDARFLTVDHWRSEQDFDRFRERYAAEFERIDALGEELTQSERALGRFGFAHGTASPDEGR